MITVFLKGRFFSPMKENLFTAMKTMYKYKLKRKI